MEKRVNRQKQPKLTDFHVRGETQKTTAGMAEEERLRMRAQCWLPYAVRMDFSSGFDGVYDSDRKYEKGDKCTERVWQAELQAPKTM